jgi:hypothetical protein
MIQMERDSDLFRTIRQECDISPVPSMFSSFMGTAKDGEYGYGDTQTTPYGDPLRATTMGQLAKCGIPGPVGAYVVASPPQQRVALYWH